ncbi:Alpha/Beta hydrolase protein [Armillaria novae-zelandiae]|uniref:Alpha/Beta hydrolase protein n=1 Tax=Armillaria novae-zelandiae TaxID=153914 RepID=A0AA39PE74_9AGAR|nr:Alpha/Beta hydrolase protein [Armillaria novae-zelandiae]
MSHCGSSSSLSVHTPGELDFHGPGKSLPVVVWIHGGGYFLGSASSFDGNNLIRESGNGIVAMIIQYRLGLFGFLAGETVKANGRLNAGLLDQQFALQWVQEHIAKFGDDPSGVTIWGESAGAGSVLQQYAFNDVVPEFLYDSAVSSTKGLFDILVFVPVVDGDFIKQRPVLTLIERKVNGEALLSVTNANKGTLFVNASTASTVQVPEYLMQLYSSLSVQNRHVAVAKYSGLGAPIDQVTLIMGESIFVCPTYFLLRAFRGKRAFKASWNMNANGVPSFSNADFDKAFADSFLAFAVSLDPTRTFEPTITPDWIPFSFQQGQQVEMRFNRTESGDLAVSPLTTPADLLDRCSFWESVGPEIGQ